MIEIKCTQEEKESLMCCLLNPDNYCFLPSVNCAKMDDCEKCLEKNIKWVVTQEV